MSYYDSLTPKQQLASHLEVEFGSSLFLIYFDGLMNKYWDKAVADFQNLDEASIKHYVSSKIKAKNKYNAEVYRDSDRLVKIWTKRFNELHNLYERKNNGWVKPVKIKKDMKLVKNFNLRLAQLKNAISNHNLMPYITVDRKSRTISSTRPKVINSVITWQPPVYFVLNGIDTEFLANALDESIIRYNIDPRKIKKQVKQCIK